jgi:ADP-ribose pyrophosphatase YjhB (NUDIX family)
MTHRPTDALNLREGVRALLLDADDHLLLVRYEFPTATVWGLPGGGLGDGEHPLDGLRRELREELGLRDVTIGPHVWNREHVIPMFTGHDGQRDRIYLARVPRFEPEPEIGWEALRSEFVHEARWWSVDEVSTATADRVLFSPRQLAMLTRQLLEAGAPDEPIDTGV